MLIKKCVTALMVASLMLVPSIAAAQDGSVMWYDHASHGVILTDSEGVTLYIFTNDEDGTSTCYDQCAENWPPLITEDEPEVGEDLAGAIGTTERDDGELQVTYHNMPLYYYIGDEEPGDTTGHGVNFVWYFVMEDTPVPGTAVTNGDDNGVTDDDDNGVDDGVIEEDDNGVDDGVTEDDDVNGVNDGVNDQEATEDDDATPDTDTQVPPATGNPDSGSTSVMTMSVALVAAALLAGGAFLRLRTVRSSR